MRRLSSIPRANEATSGTDENETSTYLSDADSPGSQGISGVVYLDTRPVEGPPPTANPSAWLLLPPALSISTQHWGGIETTQPTARTHAEHKKHDRSFGWWTGFHHAQKPRFEAEVIINK